MYTTTNRFPRPLRPRVTKRCSSTASGSSRVSANSSSRTVAASAKLTRWAARFASALTGSHLIPTRAAYRHLSSESKHEIERLGNVGAGSESPLQWAAALGPRTRWSDKRADWRTIVRKRACQAQRRIGASRRFSAGPVADSAVPELSRTSPMSKATRFHRDFGIGLPRLLERPLRRRVTSPTVRPVRLDCRTANALRVSRPRREV